jgi:hypothetical protein
VEVEVEGSIIETIEYDRLQGRGKGGLKKVTSKRRRRRNSRTKRRRRDIKEMQVIEESDCAIEQGKRYEARSDGFRNPMCARMFFLHVLRVI